MRILLSAFVLSFVLFLVVSMETTAYAANWPSWRGDDGKGVVPEGAPPIRWSETENIKWKTDLPGEGQSTPIIWGDLIILQTAIPVQEDKGEISSALGLDAVLDGSPVVVGDELFLRGRTKLYCIAKS